MNRHMRSPETYSVGEISARIECRKVIGAARGSCLLGSAQRCYYFRLGSSART